MKMFISDPKLATSLYSEIRVAWDGSFKTTMLMSFPAAPSIIEHWSRTLDKIRWNKKNCKAYVTAELNLNQFDIGFFPSVFKLGKLQE